MVLETLLKIVNVDIRNQICCEDPLLKIVNVDIRKHHHQHHHRWILVEFRLIIRKKYKYIEVIVVYYVKYRPRICTHFLYVKKYFSNIQLRKMFREYFYNFKSTFQTYNYVNDTNTFVCNFKSTFQMNLIRPRICTPFFLFFFLYVKKYFLYVQTSKSIFSIWNFEIKQFKSTLLI